MLSSKKCTAILIFNDYWVLRSLKSADLWLDKAKSAGILTVLRALLTQYKRKSALLNLVRFDSLMPKQKFMQQAEDEGFVYQGQHPTTLPAESVMILHDDYTLGKLSGFITHMQYHTYPKKMRIDYARYISGLDDYYYIK